MLGHQQPLLTPESYNNAVKESSTLSIDDIVKAQDALLSLSHCVIRPIHPNDRETIKNNYMVIPKNIPGKGIFDSLIKYKGKYKDAEKTFYYRALVHNDVVVGQIIYSHDKKELAIDALEIKAEYQNQKLGVLLINDALIKAREVNISTIKLKTGDHDYNKDARDRMNVFYIGLGFRPVAIKDDDWWKKSNKAKRHSLTMDENLSLLNNSDVVLNLKSDQALACYAGKLHYTHTCYLFKQAIFGVLTECVNVIKKEFTCSEDILAKIIMRAAEFPKYVKEYYGISSIEDCEVFDKLYKSLRQVIDTLGYEVKSDNARNKNINKSLVNYLKSLKENTEPVGDSTQKKLDSVSNPLSVSEVFEMYDGNRGFGKLSDSDLSKTELDETTSLQDGKNTLLQEISQLLDQKVVLEKSVKHLGQCEQSLVQNISDLETTFKERQAKLFDIEAKINEGEATLSEINRLVIEMKKMHDFLTEQSKQLQKTNEKIKWEAKIHNFQTANFRSPSESKQQDNFTENTATSSKPLEPEVMQTNQGKKRKDQFTDDDRGKSSKTILDMFSRRSSQAREASRESLLEQRSQLISRYFQLCNNEIAKLGNLQPINKSIPSLSPYEMDQIQFYLFLIASLKEPISGQINQQLDVPQDALPILSTYFQNHPEEAKLFSVKSFEGGKVNLLSMEIYYNSYMTLLLPLKQYKQALALKFSTPKI